MRRAKGTNELVQIEQEINQMISSSRSSNNVMMETDKEISSDLCKKLLVRYHRNLIGKVYLANLLMMHKRDAFNKFLLERMEEN